MTDLKSRMTTGRGDVCPHCYMDLSPMSTRILLTINGVRGGGETLGLVTQNPALRAGLCGQ